MERLTAEDRLVLWPDEMWPQDVGALALLDGRHLLEAGGRVRVEAVRAAIAGRLHLLPRFRQVLLVPRRGLGGPLWVDAPAFDLRDHVRVAPLSAPGDEAQLLRAVERLRRRRLDRSRPLWELWLLPGLADGRLGLFVRMHHVVADGVAGVAGLAALLDGAPDTAAVPAVPWTPAPWPSTRELFVDDLRRRARGVRGALAPLVRPAAALRRARAAVTAVRELVAAEPGPPTSLDRVIGPDRTLALVRSRLDAVRGAAHTHRATVNDVLLAAIAAGAGELLRSRGERIEDLTLPVYVPVSLRRDHPGKQGGNLISQMVVRVPVGASDPGQRLERIAAETARRKAMAHPSLGTLFRSRIASGLLLKRIAGQRVNLLSADLPGPRAPLHLARAQVLEAFPLLNLIGNVSLGVGALSYAGRFDLMVVADAAAYPDLLVFAEGVRAELQALTGRAGSSKVDPAPRGPPEPSRRRLGGPRWRTGPAGRRAWPGRG